TTRVAERNAAIHAARALLAQFLFCPLPLELAPILQPLLDGPARRNSAIDLEKSCDFTHDFPCAPKKPRPANKLKKLHHRGTETLRRKREKVALQDVPQLHSR